MPHPQITPPPPPPPPPPSSGSDGSPQSAKEISSSRRRRPSDKEPPTRSTNVEAGSSRLPGGPSHASIPSQQISPGSTPASILRRKSPLTPNSSSSPLEIDGNQSMTDSVSRFLFRMKLAGRQAPRTLDTEDGVWKGSATGTSPEGLYYGDFMTSFDAGSMDHEDPSSVDHFSTSEQPIGEPGNYLMNSLSLLTRSSIRSSRDDADSVSKFNDWTPQDSAYGAAVPLCGFLPKKIRRTIEFFMIGFMVFMLVYVVVTASMMLTREHGGDDADNYNGDYNNGGNKLADDDYYIEGWQDDDVSQDDLFDDGYQADQSTDDTSNGNDDSIRRYLLPVHLF